MKVLFKHPLPLLFGITQVFFSAPGQTFFISLFVPAVFNDIGVPQTVFSGVYAAATLLASLLLNPSGHVIDRYGFKTILLLNTALMALGCALLAVSQNIVVLFAAFFILRWIGQGVFGLTASTIIARTFARNRGRALGIMTLGFPLSELIYPTIGLFLLSVYGWRTAYFILALSNIVILLPLQWLLLSKSRIKKGSYLDGEIVVQPERLAGYHYDEEVSKTGQRQYRFKEVVRDYKFYLAIVASCIPPLLMTGLLFHQNYLFAFHGWDLKYAVSGIAFYALCKAITSVATGPVIDKYGPVSSFAALIVMLALGSALAGIGGPPVVIFLYFGIMGAALGISSPVMNVVWPNLYGTAHLGAIKGFAATFRNGLTAFGTLPIALALDFGFSLGKLLLITSFFIVLMAIIPYLLKKIAPRINEPFGD